MSGLEYLFAAYTVIWLGIFAYVFSLSRRQRALEKDLETLKGALHREKRV